MERSIKTGGRDGGLNLFFACKTLALGSAVVHKYTGYLVHMKDCLSYFDMYPI